MALPAGALGATVTVGSPIDIAGTAGTLVSLRVRPEVPAGLVWAADGTPVEPWSASATLGEAPVTALTLTILADQAGVLTSGTVDGAPQMVAIRSWPLVAEWRTKPTADAAPTKHVRRFAAPAPGTTVDLDLLPQDGALPVATITTAQSLDFSTDMVADLSIGTVTTGAAGSSAAAALTPDGDAYTLDLTIPRGDTGAQGPKGDTGDTGPQGPKGDTGNTGPQGIPGTPSSIVDAKGDLLAGTANDTLSRLAVGPDGALLMADSSAASGLSYQSPSPLLVSLITNGDFSNGTAGWSANNGLTGAVVGGAYVATIINAATGSQNVSGATASTVPAGSVVYMACTLTPFSTHSPLLRFGAVNVSGPTIPAGVASRVSARFTVAADGTIATIYTNGAALTGQAVGLTATIDNIILIDLTACFGAGREPSKAEMDALMETWGGWFAKETPKLLPPHNYDPMRRVGSGSPYGVITPRERGETWTDTAQTNGARVWTATGTTTTSWVVTDGDTGTRILTSWTEAGVVTGDALPANVAPTAGSAGSVRVQRCGAQVLYAIRGATWTAASAFTVPVGFRSATAQYRPTSVIVAGAPAAMAATVSTTTLTIGASGQSAHATNATVVTWESDPWATTLPGSPS